jgi:hypothetical protein
MSLLLTALSVNASAIADAQGATQVRVNPADVQVAVSQTTQVAVEVVDVQGLYGVDLTLKFDPSVVEVVGASAGQTPVQVEVGSFLEAGFAVANQVDNAAGIVRFAMTQVNPSPPKNGSGTLIVVHLRGKKDGATSALTLTKADLANNDGMPIPATLVTGQIRVGASSSGTATITPSSTAVNATATPPASSPAQLPAGATIAPTLTPTPAPPTAAASQTPVLSKASGPGTSTPAATSAPATQSVTWAPGTTSVSPALSTPTVGSMTQPVAGEPTAVSLTPVPDVTAPVAVSASNGTADVESTLMPGAALHGTDSTPASALTPTATPIAHNATTAASVAQQSNLTEVSRGSNHTELQTILVLGWSGISLILLMWIIVASCILLQPTSSATAPATGVQPSQWLESLE